MLSMKKGIVIGGGIGVILILWVFLSPAHRHIDKEAVEPAGSSSLALSTPRPVVKLDLTEPSPYEIGSTLRPYGARVPTEAMRPFLGLKVKWAATFTGRSARKEQVVLEFVPEKHSVPILSVTDFSESEMPLKDGESYIIDGIIQGVHGLEI